MRYNICLKCGGPVSRNSGTGKCNKCRNRTGVNNPFYGHKHSKETIENSKKKASVTLKNKWLDPEYRRRVIEGSSKPRNPNFKIEQSIRVRQYFKDHPEQRTLRSIAMSKSWKDGKIEPNINSINESKLERGLLFDLKNKLPNNNIRKTTIKIGKHWFYPDVRIDDKILIEFNGNYWHANPKLFKPNDVVHHSKTAKHIWKADKKRINTFILAGYKVFVVWEDEYKNNKEDVLNNIIKQI